MERWHGQGERGGAEAAGEEREEERRSDLGC